MYVLVVVVSRERERKVRRESARIAKEIKRKEKLESVGVSRSGPLIAHHHHQSHHLSHLVREKVSKRMSLVGSE